MNILSSLVLIAQILFIIVIKDQALIGFNFFLQAYNFEGQCMKDLRLNFMITFMVA